MKTTPLKFILYYLIVRVIWFRYTGSKMYSANLEFRLHTFWFHGPSTGDDRPSMWVSFNEILSSPSITLYYEARVPGTDLTPIAFTTNILRRLTTYIRIFNRK